jgi:hypothetical protein
VTGDGVTPSPLHLSPQEAATNQYPPQRNGLYKTQDVGIGYAKTYRKKWSPLFEFQDGEYIWKHKLTQKVNREREREREI